MTFLVELQPGRSAARAESLLYVEVARLARDGVDERELTKAKNLLRADNVRQLKTNENRAYRIGLYDFWLGKPDAVETVLSRLEAVEARQVREAAARYFQPERRTVVTLIPEGEPGAEP
jgi:predicted Zn-dependent peptidase